jgi:hypothetical protein
MSGTVIFPLPASKAVLIGSSGAVPLLGYSPVFLLKA